MKRLIILMLLPWSASALALSLSEAYEQALQNAPSIAAQTAQWRAREAEARAQKGGLLPQVNFSAGWGKLDTTRSTLSDNTPSIQYENDSKYWNFSAQQALYRADVWHQWKQYEQLSQSEKARIDAVKQQLLQQVGDLYLNALSLQENLKLQKQLVSLRQALLSALNKRFEHGQIGRGDIAQIESQLNQDRAYLAQLQAQLDIVLKQLSLYIGHSVAASQLHSPLSKLSTLATHYLKTPLSQLTEQLSQTHPEIQALKAEIRAAEESIQVQRAGHKPKVDLVLSRRMTSNDSENTLGSEYQTTSITLQLSMPIYSGGSTEASVESARQRLKAAQANLETRMLELRRQLVELHGQLSGFYLQYQHNQAQVENIKQLLTAIKKQQQAGQADKSDLIKTQYQLIQATITQVNSAYQALNAAIQLRTLLHETPL